MGFNAWDKCNHQLMEQEVQFENHCSKLYIIFTFAVYKNDIALMIGRCLDNNLPVAII